MSSDATVPLRMMPAEVATEFKRFLAAIQRQGLKVEGGIVMLQVNGGVCLACRSFEADERSRLAIDVGTGIGLILGQSFSIREATAALEMAGEAMLSVVGMPHAGAFH
ncbi:MAG: hypothetical protein HZB71_05710 [Betaproteobacteria bacterium]|nr:hypothetical protein [Betaproteobacteria bacterium]